MPSCGCARPALTSLSFGPGIVLLRCAAHEAQSWVVEGAETGSADVLASLRTLFVERRGQRQPQAQAAEHPHRRRSDIPAQPTARPTPPAVVDLNDADAQLAALLRARGLSGSWSVA
jgi:hypothetical protein